MSLELILFVRTAWNESAD